MISRSGNKNFFAAHYDMVALAAGLLVLAAGAAVFVLSLGNDPEAAADAEVAALARLKPAETGVKPLDMEECDRATRCLRAPPTIPDVSENAESFLASEKRVVCAKCAKAIPGDVKTCPVCPFCGAKQEEEKQAVVDADADPDGDGFTNAEEFRAGTDPNDRKSHPDYLDSLKIVLPLEETRMPFIFTGARQIPGGWRCEFFNPSKRDDHGRAGRTVTAVFGEEVGADDKTPSGYILRAYERKEEKRKRKGMEGMTVSVDVSEATLERKSDGRKIVLRIAANKREKPAAVDVRAKLSYERGAASKTFYAVAGDEFELCGERFRVESLERSGAGAKMVVGRVSPRGDARTIQALE